MNVQELVRSENTWRRGESQLQENLMNFGSTHLFINPKRVFWSIYQSTNSQLLLILGENK